VTWRRFDIDSLSTQAMGKMMQEDWLMNGRAQAFLLEADEITRRLFIPESSDEEFREGLYVEDVREQVPPI